MSVLTARITEKQLLMFEKSLTVQPLTVYFSINGKKLDKLQIFFYQNSNFKIQKTTFKNIKTRKLTFFTSLMQF